MRTSGSTRAHSAWVTCARPISFPSLVMKELSAMFCALKGLTVMPMSLKIRHIAAQIRLFPTDEPVP